MANEIDPNRSLDRVDSIARILREINLMLAFMLGAAVAWTLASSTAGADGSCGCSVNNPVHVKIVE